MRFFIGLVMALALGVMGCSEASGTGGDGGDGGAGGVGGEGGAAGETATVSLLTKSWEPPLIEEILEGVEVCEAGTDNCVVSDENGAAVIEIPAEQEVALTFEKEGFASYLQPNIYPEGNGFLATVLAFEQRMDEMHALVDSPFPMEGTGTLFVNTYGHREGMTYELIGGEGKLYYRDENRDWDTDLTATTSAGGGGFTEVSPGVVQIQIGGGDCDLIRGWPGDAELRFRMPVAEGFSTRVYVDCEEPQ